MKRLVVRVCNAREESLRRRLQMIKEANYLVEKYIRETSLGRDEIVKEIVEETGIDAGTVNWMLL